MHLSSEAQPNKRYLYVEWRHRDNVLVLGELSGPQFKRKIVLTSPIQELESADVSNWLGTVRDEEVLLYFHAMWGQHDIFQRKNLSSLEQILDKQSEYGIQTVISFIWYAGGLSYPHNWQRAFEKGEPLTGFIASIVAHYDKRVNVLCHSMGSRVFEGTLRDPSDPYEQSTPLRRVILFSPDLDAAVSDPDFVRLCRSAAEVVVFTHNRDRLLMLSAWAHGRERLGRSGPKGDLASSTFSHLSVIDMTAHAGGFHNHTHLANEWVHQRIREVLKR